MDWSKEWAYFPVAVFVSVLLYWAGAFVTKKDFSNTGHTTNKDAKLLSFNNLFIWLFSSVLMVWGNDLLQRQFEAYKAEHALQISFGIWLLFVFPTYFQRQSSVSYFFKNLIREFKSQLLGDLLRYLIVGLVIYALT